MRWEYGVEVCSEDGGLSLLTLTVPAGSGAVFTLLTAKTLEVSHFT